ncbi:hypothetical protein ACFCX4_05530 [Kitasatospora sp. NPDC056327]|uniref:hypothetical protein n=1 Tax=Kitasatospora sp. NPDC056327 TaxID=3345785 RepID=UPI0035DC9CF5
MDAPWALTNSLADPPSSISVPPPGPALPGRLRTAAGPTRVLAAPGPDPGPDPLCDHPHPWDGTRGDARDLTVAALILVAHGGFAPRAVIEAHLRRLAERSLTGEATA